MNSRKTNPHIGQPSQEQLSDLLQGRDPEVCAVYMAAHRLVLETLPDVKYSVDCKDATIGYGARQYGYDGWGVAAVAVHTKWASLLFLRGTDLEDPQALLEGTGKKMRHVKLRSLEQFQERRTAIQRLLQEAARLNDI